MKIKISACYVVFLCAVVLTFSGCDDDEPAPSGKYETGVFVINEGALGAGNGSVTYSSFDGVAEQNIFLNSQGKFAGDVAQSLTFSNDQAFIVINGDNKIEVADANTFASVKTITDAEMDKPRYVEV